MSYALSDFPSNFFISQPKTSNMRNHRFVCLWVLTLVLPVTAGCNCVSRDWNICAPQDREPCLPGYVCTPDLLCVRAGDGGSDGAAPVDSQRSTDAAGANAEVALLGGSDVSLGAGPDAAGASVEVALLGGSDVSLGAGPDAPMPPMSGSTDALADTVADSPAAASPPDVSVVGVADALAADAPSGGVTVDASGLCTADKDCAARPGTPACATSGLCVACTANKYCTGTTATCDAATNQCVECTKRSDCVGTCQTCTNRVCTAVKNQDDLGVCAGTCDSTGACKSKQGQPCQTAGGGCASGTTCSPDGYCCDKACTGSCEGITYQAAGTCSSGVCQMPLAQTCANGNTCQPSTGTCGCSNTTCGSACVVLATDPKNCGSCKHDCLGGTCRDGQCQAAVVVSGAGAPYVIGVDSGNVYYQAGDSGTGITNAYWVSKTAIGGTGSPLDVGGSSVEYLGVIGTKLLFDMEGDFGMCDFSSSDPTHCSATTSTLPDSGNPVGFKSPSPAYLATYDRTIDLFETVNWYSTVSTTPVQSYGEAADASYWGFFGFGDSVYWIRDQYVSDTSATIMDSTLYTASVSNSNLKRLTANLLPDTYRIIDANAQSVLLVGPNGLYRVALPDGDAANVPQWLVAPASSANPVIAATEDAKGVYWFEDDGTLYSCPYSACGAGKKALANGQGLGGATNAGSWPTPLFQDGSALYWGNSSAGQVMRLVK